MTAGAGERQGGGRTEAAGTTCHYGDGSMQVGHSRCFTWSRVAQNTAADQLLGRPPGPQAVMARPPVLVPVAAAVRYHRRARRLELLRVAHRHPRRWVQGAAPHRKG